MCLCAIFKWVLVIVCISNWKKRKSCALSQVILLIPPGWGLSMEEILKKFIHFTGLAHVTYVNICVQCIHRHLFLKIAVDAGRFDLIET